MTDSSLQPTPPLPPRGDLRRRVLAGEPTIGAFVNLGSVAAAEMVARAGFDWVVIDLEHGMGSEADLHAQLLAVQGTPTTAVVRVASAERLRVGRALDMGADGLMIPRLETAGRGAPTRCAGCATRRPGSAAWRCPDRGGGYGELGHGELAATVNARILGVFQVESPEAVDAAGDIAAIEGVDVLFVGPADLSHSMGIPGRLDEPAFVAALDAVVAAAGRGARRRGSCCATRRASRPRAPRGSRSSASGPTRGFVTAGARWHLAASRAALG